MSGWVFFAVHFKLVLITILSPICYFHAFLQNAVVLLLKVNCTICSKVIATNEQRLVTIHSMNLPFSLCAVRHVNTHIFGLRTFTQILKAK